MVERVTAIAEALDSEKRNADLNKERMKGAGGAVGGSGTHLGCRRSNLPFWGRGAIGNGSGGYGAGLKGSMWQLGHGIGWGSAHGHSGRVREGQGG